VTCGRLLRGADSTSRPPMRVVDGPGPRSSRDGAPARAAAGRAASLSRRSALAVSPLDEERAAWYRGALGEAAVGRLLEKLPEGWTVLHAVPVGKGDSDIDHVVIGPGGVFTINIKNHAGHKVGGRAHLLGERPEAAAPAQRRARSPASEPSTQRCSRLPRRRGLGDRRGGSRGPDHPRATRAGRRPRLQPAGPLAAAAPGDSDSTARTGAPRRLGRSRRLARITDPGRRAHCCPQQLLRSGPAGKA